MMMMMMMMTIADKVFFYLPTDAQYLMLFIPMCGARGSAVG